MEVILLEKVGKLGDLGDQVVVKPGFGRNFLIPYGKAVPATAEKKAEFESRRAELEKLAAEQRSAADARAKQLDGLEVTIPAHAGDDGKLFGSVGTREIAEAATAAATEIDKSEVRLPEGVIRQVGEYDIDVQLHSDVTVTIKVSVVADRGE